MKSTLQLLVACAFVAMVFGGELGYEPEWLDDCPEEYKALDPRHTMCMKDVGTPISVSRKLRKAVVKAHNEFRGNVTPPAANMLKMKWNGKLAQVAEKWALQCRVGHDKSRRVPGLSLGVGQNMAAGQADLVGAVGSWAKEIKDFTYGSAPTGVVGHYTQIVNANSFLVGCGSASCPDSKYKKFHICNYATGQMGSAYTHPYVKGDEGCDDCPDKCDENLPLCDCRGLICQNRGKLDLATCKCQCPKPYKGRKCHKVDCYADAGHCGQYKDKHGVEKACKFSNVPGECPHMCGLC